MKGTTRLILLFLSDCYLRELWLPQRVKPMRRAEEGNNFSCLLCSFKWNENCKTKKWNFSLTDDCAVGRTKMMTITMWHIRSLLVKYDEMR